MIQAYEDDIFFDALGMRVWEQRHRYVDDILTQEGCSRILDMGCNEGKFLQRLTRDVKNKVLVGVDIDERNLSLAQENLKPESIQDQLMRVREQQLIVQLYQGDATKRSQLLRDYNFDAITMIEMIEHIHLHQLEQLVDNIFGFMSPRLVVITTPNSDFNIYFKQKNPEFTVRNDDHKYEFSMKEFREFIEDIERRYPYQGKIDGVMGHKSGDLTYGYCSQIVVFRKLNDLPSSLMMEHQEPTRIFCDIPYPFDGRTTSEKVLQFLEFECCIDHEVEDWTYELRNDEYAYKLQRILSLLVNKFQESDYSSFYQYLRCLNTPSMRYYKWEGQEYIIIVKNSYQDSDDQFEEETY